MAREPMEDPTFWELPENVGQYRNDRRNVYLDGNSNLVFHAAKDGNTFYSGKVFSTFYGGIGHTWEARIKLNCLTPGSWPAWYLSNDNPVNGGEVDIMEWYGNGKWAPGTAVHANLNGGNHASQTISVDSAWHTWRVQWDDAGMRFWKDYTDGAQPYFSVPAGSLSGWQFNDPRLHVVSGAGSSGRRLRWWRSRTGDLSRRHADRLGACLVAHRPAALKSERSRPTPAIHLCAIVPRRIIVWPAATPPLTKERIHETTIGCSPWRGCSSYVAWGDALGDGAADRQPVAPTGLHQYHWQRALRDHRGQRRVRTDRPRKLPHFAGHVVRPRCVSGFRRHLHLVPGRYRRIH